MLLLLLESHLPCVYNDVVKRWLLHSTYTPRTKPHYYSLTAVQSKEQSKSEPAYTNDDEIDNKIVFPYFATTYTDA